MRRGLHGPGEVLRLALVILAVLATGVSPAVADAPESLEGFAKSMFEALGAGARSCHAPADEIEDRHCAAVKASSAKLKREWDSGVADLGSAVPVTDWQSGRGLVWRYHVIDGRPIVVQFNSKSKTLEILGSSLPKCESSIPQGMVEILGGGEESTPPVLKYRQAFFWPFRAHKANQVGKVRLIGVVTTGGDVSDLCLDSLEPPIVDLELASVKAVRRWRFEPAMTEDGPAETRVPFSFELDPEDAEKVRLGF